MASWVSVAAASRDLRRKEVVGTDADRGSSLEGEGLTLSTCSTKIRNNMCALRLLVCILGVNLWHPAIAGTPRYEGIFVGGNRSNGVVIVRTFVEEQYLVEFKGEFGRSAGSGSQGGEISGFVTRIGKHYQFRVGLPSYPKEGCTMKIRFIQQAMIVDEEKGCADFHGAAAEFTGRYRKIFTFPPLHGR